MLNSRPVLCASCHSDNALGAPGKPGIPSLAQAMHGKHAEVFGGGGDGATQSLTKLMAAQATNYCYDCHPGPQTQCLRDVMYTHGKTCTDCHGDMNKLADPARRPWIDEPRCETCHGTKFAENSGKRYRDSVGHGGLYCESCHGSPHAILPTNQPNDNIQNISLQGYAGTLDKCSVCHTTTPSGPGPHGISAPPVTPSPPPSPSHTPPKPKLKSPANGAKIKASTPKLTWNKSAGATSYKVQVLQGSTSGPVAASTETNTLSFKTPRLTGNRTLYYWSVSACNNGLCSDWSPYRTFTITIQTALNQSPPNSSPLDSLAWLVRQFTR